MGSQQRAILLGALVTGLLATVFAIIGQGNTSPVLGIAACCLPSLLGPLTAIWNYTNTESLSISTGEGAKMGFMAGAGGGLIAGVLSYVLRMVGVIPSEEEVLAKLRDTWVEQGLTAEQIETAEKMTGFASGPIAIIISIVVLGILGAIIGMIGAAIFKKGDEGGVV